MMQPNTAEAQRSGERPKQRGRPWPKGVSGNPHGRTKGRRHLELVADLARDLGGEAALSAIERALIGQAASLLLRAEKAGDTNDAVRCANAAARILFRVKARKQRNPDGPSLQEYVAAKYGSPK